MNPPGHNFVYRNCEDALFYLPKEISNYGDEIYSDQVNATEENVLGLEMIGVNIQILNWSDRSEALKKFGYNLEFAEQDFKDRINPEKVNPGEAINYDTSGVLKPYIYSKSGRLSYTYSERMHPQLSMIIENLKKHPGSRQSYLSIWHPNSDGRFLEKRRVPCSIGYHFLLRNDELHMLYLMRSMDANKCFGYDIYTSSKLLEYISDELYVDRGFLHMFIGSAHIFKGENIE